ncbi:MAG: oligopeptide:H+ symporter [Bacteroidota bacterium]
MNSALNFLIFGWVFVAVWIPFVVFSQRKVHPKALFTLFFAELWERFSFYGMRALLTLYMTKVLFFDMGQELADARALGIYGAYGALVYAAPVIGGLLADRILGFRRAILLGGILMALGHFVLAFEGSLILFFLSLSLIVVGNGFFKPNISSFLGTFYEPNDARKDGAFTIFYMGVNIGAFLAPLTCGYLGEHPDFGWSWGFGLAGIGMLAGLIVFWNNMKQFGDKGLPPNPELLKKPVFAGLNQEIVILLGIVISIPLIGFLLDNEAITSWLLIAITIAVIGYLVYTATNAKDKSEGQRLLVVVVLFFFHALFWALFEQAGGSLVLFADRFVDREIFGSAINASQFASVNPLFIILLAPAFSWMWVKLNQANREPSTPMKFVLGLAQLALGFGIVVLGATVLLNDEGMVPLVFLIVMYLFHTTGELSLSPVGLSMVTKLSPAKVVGFVMGAWFLSISLAHKIAAALGTIASTSDDAGVASYAQVYMTWGVLVIGGASLVLLVMVPTLRKWMHGIH